MKTLFAYACDLELPVKQSGTSLLTFSRLPYVAHNTNVRPALKQQGELVYRVDCLIHGPHFNQIPCYTVLYCVILCHTVLYSRYQLSNSRGICFVLCWYSTNTKRGHKSRFSNGFSYNSRNASMNISETHFYHTTRASGSFGVYASSWWSHENWLWWIL